MKAKITTSLALALILCIVFSCQKNSQSADLIILNATIWTGNQSQPIAQAMAIADDQIITVGTDVEILARKSDETRVLDMNGKFITPGFIDTHVHLLAGGRSLLSVELRDASTPQEFTKRIADHAQTLEPGAWILEGNWDHTLWGGKLPHKDWIDEFTQDNPVVVFRLDGHMVLANSAALKIAGIDKNTSDVPGGEIVRNLDGSPTGILKDNSMNVLLEKIPAMSAAEKEKAFTAAMTYFLANGVTSVHDVDSNYSIPTAHKLLERQELSIRIYQAKPLNHWERFSEDKRLDNKWLKDGALKGFVDGSLGSHTAAFKEAYSDKVGDKGFFLNTSENLYHWISGADKASFQLFVHAIGDSAISSLLDIYERVIEENGPRDRRLRIEHAQHIAPEDIKRFAELGVIASMQPYHAIDDGRWAEESIGPERIKTTYAFKALLDADAMVVFGSDWAVAPATPLEGIYAATTRRTLDNENPDGWVPEQKISAEQALFAYTRDAAYSAFEENFKGTLEPGKLADFVVLDESLFQVDPVKIKDIQVLQTYVGGKKVFDRNED